MNISFETFGCRLSRAEALDCEAYCLSIGHRLVHSHAEADLFIVRGCSVTRRAQADSEHMIRHLREHYPNKRVIVMGCLPGAAKELDIPASTRMHPDPSTGPTVSTRTARAYLKVQDGCAGQCAFCIVPKFRGESVSEPFDDVLAKAKKFIEAGYHEIVVTGCNLALYASEGKRLPDLLAALAALDANCRIRLGSLEPWGCADEVVDAMAENDNICRFLHLPVQTGSDRLLKLMKRPYALEDVERIVNHAKERMPLVGLGCDLMTGFPTESEGDFMRTKMMLSQLAFSNAHVFPYSERPGTPAALMPGVVQKSVRSERAHTLSDAAKANRQRFARRFVGKIVQVIIESREKHLKGWTGEYLWFEGPVRETATAANANYRKQKMRFLVRSADKGVLHGTLYRNGR